MTPRLLYPLLTLLLTNLLFSSSENPPKVERWSPVELVFESSDTSANPYTALEFWAVFTNEQGDTLKRPGFWDGGNTWKLRFAPPARGDRWTYTTFCSDPANRGLHGRTGELRVVTYAGSDPFRRHGLLRMSEGRRNVVHADGTPFLLVGDTPWALPFRGTVESVTAYARNRQERGFNAALLMCVQPDRNAVGPRDRAQPGSFGVAFEDLPGGGLNQLNPDYFQLLDQLVGILHEHGIVPVFNPVFQGFGWKGLHSHGSGANPSEYARYQKYLIARFGASPAFWLVSADATGRDPVVAPAGETTEEWDAYGQPTGIHYSPFDDRKANWSDDPKNGFHHNRIHQEAAWLDFQWAQTGHDALHLPEKVGRMYENQPVKAAANGEPTYERMGAADRATGWWQGHEAWLNLVSGGTMGHVYGAGALWNWKLSADETGWPDWANTPASWREALEFEGSRYVGYLARAFSGLPFTDMARRPDLAGGHNLLTVPGKFYLSYLPEGGSVTINDITPGLPWRWFNPRKGEFITGGTTGTTGNTFQAPDPNPWVLIVGVRQGP